MPCTERGPRGRSPAGVAATLAACALLGACGTGPAPVEPVSPVSPVSTGTRVSPPTPSLPAARGPAPVAPATPPVALEPARPAATWDDFRRQAAQRMVAASPQGSYTGPVPEPLLAIPVLEVELNRDGSVRDIRVMRHPTQARDTTQLAIDAVRRAAPYGDMSRLSRPWKFAEVFLFDDDRRFKPRTLD